MQRLIPLFCDVHEDDILNIICVDSNCSNRLKFSHLLMFRQLICAQCFHINHNGHQILPLKKFIQEYNQQLSIQNNLKIQENTNQLPESLKLLQDKIDKTMTSLASQSYEAKLLIEKQWINKDKYFRAIINANNLSQESNSYQMMIIKIEQNQLNSQISMKEVVSKLLQNILKFEKTTTRDFQIKQSSNPNSLQKQQQQTNEEIKKIEQELNSIEMQFNKIAKQIIPKMLDLQTVDENLKIFQNPTSPITIDLEQLEENNQAVIKAKSVDKKKQNILNQSQRLTFSERQPKKQNESNSPVKQKKETLYSKEFKKNAQSAFPNPTLQQQVAKSLKMSDLFDSQDKCQKDSLDHQQIFQSEQKNDIQDGEINLNLTDFNRFQASRSQIQGIAMIDEEYLAFYQNQSDSFMIKIFNFKTADQIHTFNDTTARVEI